MAFIRDLFTKKTPAATPQMQIGSPNGNGLRDDADAPIPIKHGLVHTKEEQAKLYDQLVSNGLKAMPNELQIGSPNGNGLRSDANAPIPVKNGLVRSPEQQMQLLQQLATNDGKTKPTVPQTQHSQEQSKVEQRGTIYKPMPQNLAALDELETGEPQVSLSQKKTDLLAERAFSQTSQDARSKGFEHKKSAIDQNVHGPRDAQGTPPPPPRNHRK